MPSSEAPPPSFQLPFQSPFQSPNAIPPRTSSHGIANGVKHRSSVLRPLSEIDWISQSKKSKLSHENQPQMQNQNQPSSRPADSQTIMGGEEETSGAQQDPLSLAPPQPPPQPHGDIGHDLIYGPRRRWSEDNEKILLGPYDYLVGHPGKDIRSQCIAAFNKWLKVPAERLEVITRVVGMLHTASLLYGHLSIMHTQCANRTAASTTWKTRPSSAAASPSQTPSSASPKL
jgi:geranylgeranyl diphosphate synthase type 3